MNMMILHFTLFVGIGDWSAENSSSVSYEGQNSNKHSIIFPSLEMIQLGNALERGNRKVCCSISQSKSDEDVFVQIRLGRSSY